MLKLRGILIISSLCFLLANGITRSDTYIQNSGIEDLETSASGYSYQARSGTPFNYKSFSSESDGIPYEFDQPSDSIGRYSNQPIPLNLLPLSPNFVPNYDSKSVDSYGEMLAPYAKGYEHFVDENFAKPNHHERQSTNFIKGGGSNYEDGVSASSGEKGTKGYSNRDEFAKGLKGRHQNDQRKGFYDVLGGDKRGHQEQEGHYSTKHHSAKGNKGGSFSEESSHDKGSKTTGYHKVYHKDEYKKDKSFYDKQDKKGHFNRYGNFNAKAGSDAGIVINGKSVDAGFRQGEFGAKGLSEKGRFLDEASGYRGANGDASHYRNDAAYANKAGKSRGSEGGYSETKGDYAEDK
ncbi:uncharacterized protein LOC114340365 [Diabrotica virgifera virgifera]|uniref:Uncharacterized protein n=1 Tax=Diabrotica virgifera virgifera TaxID=50390 RepID=A0ABM5K0S6_DIAVI|nr:uncharacterized protein LOC114340365 [Diabrotica virgifera virgifera]